MPAYVGRYARRIKTWFLAVAASRHDLAITMDSDTAEIDEDSVVELELDHYELIRIDFTPKLATVDKTPYVEFIPNTTGHPITVNADEVKEWILGLLQRRKRGNSKTRSEEAEIPEPLALQDLTDSASEAHRAGIIDEAGRATPKFIQRFVQVLLGATWRKKAFNDDSVHDALLTVIATFAHPQDFATEHSGRGVVAVAVQGLTDAGILEDTTFPLELTEEAYDRLGVESKWMVLLGQGPKIRGVSA